MLSSVAPGHRLLVAVSGGADSVALAHLLKSLPFTIVIAHIDHGLRKNSTADARFVAQLARSWDVPCVIQRVPVRPYAKARRLGIEEAARHLRYAALAAQAKRLNCRAIVTAHHADDQAETVLFNVLRGAGAAGLSGMAPARRLADGCLLLRPLLTIGRRDLRDYGRSYQLPFREDPSNRDLGFTRNRLRHKTLPSLERDFPGLPKRLTQMAEVFRSEEEYWRARVKRDLPKVARRKGSGASVDLKKFLGYHTVLGRRILRSLLPSLSYYDSMRLMAFAASPHKTARLQLTGGLSAFRKGNTLLIAASRQEASLRNL